jgi:hypothetical protein
LKAPAHLFGLESLLEVYPDARLLFTRRDPAEALPSLANLTRLLRGAFSDSCDPAAIGREVAESWRQALKRTRDFLASMPDLEDRSVVIDYEALNDDPLNAIRRVYEHFGVELRAGVMERMQEYLQRHPKNRFGRHRYSLEQFSLDAGTIARQFEHLQDYRNPLMPAPESSGKPARSRHAP